MGSRKRSSTATVVLLGKVSPPAELIALHVQCCIGQGLQDLEFISPNQIEIVE